MFRAAIELTFKNIIVECMLNHYMNLDICYDICRHFRRMTCYTMMLEKWMYK